MNDLQDLERHIEDELSMAEERRRFQDDIQRRSFIEFDQRHERYTIIADHVKQTLIWPRMRKAAEYFRQAQISDCNDTGKDRCVLCVGQTPRFPATAKLELVVSRDAQCQTLVVLSSLEILPVFFPFEAIARLGLPLGRVNDDAVTAWVD